MFSCTYYAKHDFSAHDVKYTVYRYFSVKISAYTDLTLNKVMTNYIAKVVYVVKKPYQVH